VTRERAIQIAEAARLQFRVPAALRFRDAEKRIIQLVEGETAVVAEALPNPGPVYDLVVWAVTFGAGGTNVELAVHENTGRVVRIRSSG
jgi:hypothetical protein